MQNVLSHLSHGDVIKWKRGAFSLTIVYWTVYPGADQRKHQSSASLAFVCGIYRWSVNSPYKSPVTQKKFPFDDVIMHLQSVYSRMNIVLVITYQIRVGWGNSVSNWGPRSDCAITTFVFVVACYCYKMALSASCNCKWANFIALFAATFTTVD